MGKPRVTQHHEGRLAACREQMAKAKVDAILLDKAEDITYLTGFTGEDSALVLRDGKTHLVTDSRYDEQARRECPWLPRIIRKGPLMELVAKRVKRWRIERLGVDQTHLSTGDFDTIGKAVGRRTLKRVGPLIGKLRQRKDDREVEIILEAIDIAQQAFAATRKTIRPGQTERQVAARLEYELQRRGASGSSFPPIVASGRNAAMPHARAGAAVITGERPVLLDWGAKWRGYCSDLTRVLVPDTISPRLRRMYQICLEAQQRAIAAIRPGIKMRRVDRIARQYIKDAGYGDYFGHGLGHGIGLEIHESPALSPRSKDSLETGMVVTVEPGIYVPGVGGIRIEDDVLVTEDGHRVLSWLPKGLDDMRLGA